MPLKKTKIIKHISKVAANIVSKKVVKNETMIEYINNRIANEICEKTIDSLRDECLLDEYRKCKSVKNEINKLEKILTKHNVESAKMEMIIGDYLHELIPPGTKGVCRGNKFNKLVKDKIESINLNTNRFEIRFEKKCPDIDTPEIPDWYILEKSSGKIIIGMNQLDLWSGGQQINRGYKYLIDNKLNTINTKLLCVVCNKIKFSNNNSKAFRLFEVGFSNNTLCYLNNLSNIINDFFN
jgi:hypothetical protein